MEGWNDCPLVPEVVPGVRKISGKKKRPQRVGHDFGLSTPTPTGTPTMTPVSSFAGDSNCGSRNITPMSLAGQPTPAPTPTPPPPRSRSVLVQLEQPKQIAVAPTPSS